MTFDVNEDDAGSSGADSDGESTSGDSGAVGATCGDNVVEAGEVCDGDDLDGQTCALLGLPEGELGCSADCSAFDPSGCGAAPPDPCGNGVLDPGEPCDGTELDGQSCASLGLPEGELGCSADCSSFDPSGCAAADPCGNGALDPAEACDGSELDGQSCASLGLPAGELGCSADCSTFDPSGCMGGGGGACGDGSIDAGEVCDGAHLAGQTCASQGFDSGTLGCAADCTSFDHSECIVLVGDCCSAHDSPGCADPACTAAVCGLDAYCCDEAWDVLCADEAVANADAAGACAGAGTCGSPAVCGDGVVNGTDVCDGAALGGQTCQSLGFEGGGTLACHAGCGAFDTSGCVDWVGSCCSDNGSPGCEDEACTTAVCAADPFCCSSSWDALCAVSASGEAACAAAAGC